MTKASMFKSVVALVVVLVSVGVLLWQVPPQTIVDYIGIENTYLTVFLVASFGGLSIFTSGVLYASLSSFAAGGASPWLLGLAGGVGIAIGDTIIFSLFKYGLRTVDHHKHPQLQRWRERLRAFPRWGQGLALYLLIGLTPIPNDIVMGLLAFFGYSYRFVVPITLCAAITIATLTALAGDVWLADLWS